MKPLAPKQRRHGCLPRLTTVIAITHTLERPGGLAGSGVRDRFLERGDKFVIGLGADVLLIAHHMVVDRHCLLPFTRVDSVRPTR